MPTERQSPGAILSQTNLTGVIADIQDDPDSPDANWLTADSDGAETVVRVSFPTPTGNPNTGAELQQYKIWVRRSAPGGNVPTANLQLYENGAAVLDADSAAIESGNIEVTSETGQLITFSWDAVHLATADGSLVECRVVGKRSGGSPANRRTVETGAVEWNVDYTGGAGATLAAAPPISLSVAAALQTAIQMAAIPGASLTVVPNLSTAIQIAVAQSQSINAAASLTTSIEMAGTPLVSVDSVAALQTAIQMGAAPGVSASIVAALTAGANTEMAAAADLSINSTSLLQTAIQLKAAPNLSVSASSALLTAIRLVASPALSISAASALATAIELASAVNVSTGVIASLTAGANTEMAAAVNASISSAAALQTAIEMVVNPSVFLTFTLNGDLSTSINLAATLSFSGIISATLGDASKLIQCSLVDRNGNALPNLSGLSWAWFDGVDPGLFIGPTDRGEIEGTDPQGLINILIPGTTLDAGQNGTLVLRSDDGALLGAYKLVVEQ